ncbi:hypothetical protein ACRS3X_07955 [Ectopseudomonas hydrolytica]|uniref:hypothetical protein n=1 Tax=Ectopseudomonas hydrolytica TaxID=2493633 RepID=UPI003EE35583
MQCPSCNYEAPTASFGDPLRCPECGAFYEKALELKLKRSPSSAQDSVTPSKGAAPTPYTNGLIPCRSCRAAISKKAASCPHCGAVAKKKTSVLTWIFAVIAGLWLIGYISNLSSVPTTTSAGSASPLQAAQAATTLEDFSWSKSAGGSLMKADFTIRNGGNRAIKDIEIVCEHQGPSGTKIDSNTRTIYEIVPAGTTRTFTNFDMGFIHSQAVSSSCRIKKISI